MWRGDKECWFVDMTKPNEGLGFTLMNVEVLERTK